MTMTKVAVLALLVIAVLIWVVGSVIAELFWNDGPPYE